MKVHWPEKSSLWEFVFKGENDKKKKKEGQRIRQGLDGKCIGRVWSLVSVQCEVTVGFCSA